VRLIVDLGKKQTLKSMCGKIPGLKDLPEIKALKAFEYTNCYFVIARLVSIGFKIEPESPSVVDRLVPIIKKFLEEA
jgi:hypothetical protein